MTLNAADWAARSGLPDLVTARTRSRALTAADAPRLVEIAGSDPRAARFLTFWSPPRYLLHCSQAAAVDSRPMPRNQPSTLQIFCPRSGCG